LTIASIVPGYPVKGSDDIGHPHNAGQKHPFSRPEDIGLSVAPPGYTNYCPLLSTLVVVGHIGGFGIIHCNLGKSVIIYINLFFAAILGIAKVVIIFLAPAKNWNGKNDASPAAKGSPDS
jgi:hypothetical protein